MSKYTLLLATPDVLKDYRFPTGVLQVTWQRHFKDESVENLATYNKRFGQQVNEPYQGKVFFAEASLSSTSIILKNVTWEDDSCYICSFNVYPDGSKRKQTCLTVQGKFSKGILEMRSKQIVEIFDFFLLAVIFL